MASFLEHLLRRSDSVTFYEAIEVLDAARAVDRVSDAALRAMIHLHDAPHATDGARAILAPYIKTQTSKRASELALGKRPLLLADRNKTARAQIGDTLRLHLPERRASGFLWRVVQADGPVIVTRANDRADAPATAYFEAFLEGPGCADIALTEAFEGRHAPQNNRELSFEMRIYVDPPAGDLMA